MLFINSKVNNKILFISYVNDNNINNIIHCHNKYWNQ